MNLATMDAYLYETKLKDLWSLLHRTLEVAPIVSMIINSQHAIDSEINRSQEERPKPESYLILASQYPISAFTINHTSKGLLAFENESLLCEIEVESSRRFFMDNKRFSSSDSISNPSSVGNNSAPSSIVIRRSVVGSSKGYDH